MAHNWSFEDILKEMPLADSFGVEEFHPRMVAYLIRMGDLCDMDNNRFNGVGIKVFGNLGEENLAHYFKHKSVETLHISSDGIVVVANTSLLPLISSFMSFSTCLPLFTIDTVNWCAVLM